MRKKALILFDGAHLAYSPTVIGLYDSLAEHFDVGILAENPEAFDFERLTTRRVIYRDKLKNQNRLRIYRRIFDFLAIFDKQIAWLRQMNFDTDVIYDFTVVRRQIRAESPDIIIAVDFRNLLYAQILDKPVEFLSLEIVPGDKFYQECDFKNIRSVVIQTKERYEHLFGKRQLKTFLVQNAPVYVAAAENNLNRRNLVYCGTAWNPFGFYHCLEFLRAFPEYTMRVKGAISNEDKRRTESEYADLLSAKRLIFDSEYLDDAVVVDYLRQFRIGFCFYNFELEQVNNFNYQSAPSGKMFKYMAAGVPTIGQDILGLQPVKEFDCGVLIADLEPASIRAAIEKIEKNFDYYSQNCLKAAAYYSFDKTVKSFVDYLTGK